ncbi:MAG: hypothetical protein KDI82_10910 [Gammaproteobacteria bacterium]|nr:hypothetical protein [Gammaproteobacteria bacterium]
MKIAILIAGALLTTNAVAADFELSDGLLDTVSAGNTAQNTDCGATGCYELLEGVDLSNLAPAAITLPSLPSHIKVRTPREPSETTNAAVTVTRPALELLQQGSSTWQGGLADPITVERLSQPQRSSTFALQQLLSGQ